MQISPCHFEHSEKSIQCKVVYLPSGNGSCIVFSRYARNDKGEREDYSCARLACFRNSSFALMTISTRRFCARPSTVLLSATGSLSPKPRVVNRDALTLAATINALTAS